MLIKKEWFYVDKKITVTGFAKYRLERAKQDLSDAEFNYQNRRYLNANNRAYYAIFHAIRAVLATERIDFKRHKDVLAYFNQYYVKTEVFPRSISRKISQASKVREDSDYDDEFVPTDEETKIQIDTAKELIELVERYLSSFDE
ncbi:MAG: HEPN domain-containing protein [Clostridia bacterium]|nr:HEPN domain-containing protein [Clostridia bacterium]